jgi:uncharacterized protein (DUF952 family)
MDTDKYIIHICRRNDWDEGQTGGKYQALSLGNEGFIHCSRPEQVLTVINRFYQDVPDLILLWIDPDLVAAEIRWEAADGEIFPHLYGPLNTHAVVAVREVFPDPDGVYRAEININQN